MMDAFSAKSGWQSSNKHVVVGGCDESSVPYKGDAAGEAKEEEQGRCRRAFRSRANVRRTSESTEYQPI